MKRVFGGSKKQTPRTQTPGTTTKCGADAGADGEMVQKLKIERVYLEKPIWTLGKE